MVVFFKKGANLVYAVETNHKFSPEENEKLTWLFAGATPLSSTSLKGRFIGPRKEMITPWSTNAVEITQNMGIEGITRIEEFHRTTDAEPAFDKMLSRLYEGINSRVFTTTNKAAAIERIKDISEYNKREGLALSKEEEDYLRQLAERLGRPLTDSEVFGFSQVNSEHCRHKIFNGSFVIDGEEKPLSLFKLIKKTSQVNPGKLVSAYKDNVAFVEGPTVAQFYPTHPERPDYFEVRDLPTVLSLKAETHNFPTTVEPFNGAATGSGGEIRDRLGGGRASLPLAGTAVYMTSYPRLGGHPWELMMNPRAWLYQTPAEILIKASNGASDFGNKFGQPLICGSLLTFEHDENGKMYAYDKVIMLAGGVGYAAAKDAIKGVPEAGEAVVVMGGDNYRIGMGGGAVSSVETGQYASGIELNAVQRANPEMQKRVSNVIRALAENDNNPIVSIHDHGAGGHLNALSELVEETGGKIEIGALPVGDKTLSSKEIIGNESQERMGMVLKKEDIDYVKTIADRERAPMYVVGETTGDHRFVFEQPDGVKPIDLAMTDMFGSSPKTTLTDSTVVNTYKDVRYDGKEIEKYVTDVLALEAVASKDWLTAPQVALIDSAKGSVVAVAEALTNIVTTPLTDGIRGLSLSANWMWPCKNPGEDAALYRAVEACSDFACAIGVNIPTGKDSLSMTQKYGDDKVYAPGTVIISAAGEVSDVRKTLSPVLSRKASILYYIDFSSDALKLGGSALAQALGSLGADAPTVADPARFVDTFSAVQELVRKNMLLAAHDVSAGGLVTTVLEMTFANTAGGVELDLNSFDEKDLVKILFAENPALVAQVEASKIERVDTLLTKAGVKFHHIGEPTTERTLIINHHGTQRLMGIDHLRDVWMHTSYLMDSLQSGEKCARARFENYKKQPIRYRLPAGFDGKLASRGISLRRDGHGDGRPRAAIIREKGVNGDREMAYSLYLAGFDVKDVHMTDLMSGRETLEDVNMIVFCGGFSNSDVLGSAKGWASGFRYNDNARRALENFYKRQDTLSLGICNGCQLMIELNLINPTHTKKTAMLHNDSHKFESQFLGVNIPANNSVMLGSLSGSKLGIWVAHGEGKFHLPMPLDNYNVVAKYAYSAYPANPNGSRASVAGICSDDGRHLAMMPHLERAIFPWQCGFYPATHAKDEVTPWIDAFINARKWVEQHVSH
ncbi:MAG: phosphoribosylformylglycinamidine synthase [Muribaculaceae bacterium]|nr:phosphoribosylformylglycinamidine synthase [Muribaculaceae bacterium]